MPAVDARHLEESASEPEVPVQMEPASVATDSETVIDPPAGLVIQSSLPVTLPGTDWPKISPPEEAKQFNHERKERVDKSALALSEPKRLRDLGHLASKPCLICGGNRSHAHHLKFAQPAALGRKVSDQFTVPLCAAHHRELHRHGDERVWWAAHKFNPLGEAEERWLARRTAKLADDPAVAVF